MKFTRLFILLSLALNVSCKPPQQTNDTASKPAEQTVAMKSDPQPALEPGNNDSQAAAQQDQATGTQSTENPQSLQSTKETKYRLIISFISIGEGTDRNAKGILDSFLSDWKIKQKKEINYEPVPWGREGEIDFCFPLHELNEKQQNQFVREIKEKFNGHSLVQFTENEPCLHKR